MIRAFQWDLARQTERRDWLMRQLPRYADWGYQELYLHLEDAVEFPSVPGVARADAYSYRQMEQLVAAARKVGIGVVPIVNLLGHTQYLIKAPALRELNELLGPDGRPLERGQICPLHPRTLEVADRLIGDMSPFCTAGKIHVGLDESYHLGQHPLSRAEVARIGLAAHFGRYVQRLHRLVEPRGLRMGLWADMPALLPEAVKFLPRGTIAYDWYYYPFARAPAMELHNFRPYDLAPALRRQGVEYWGCPMSGPFRFEPMPTFGDRLANLRSWWDRCERVKAGGLLVTSWEPSRVAAPVGQAVDAAAANLWLKPRARSNRAMLTAGLRRTMAKSAGQAGAMATAALTADRFAYAGYFRWEIDENWDFGRGRGDGAQMERERKFFDRLAKRARAGRWPRAWAASWEFRAWLAARDEWVVQGTTKKAKLKGRFKAALRAARAMWRCTREADVAGPNELAVKREIERWNALPPSPPRPRRASPRRFDPPPRSGPNSGGRHSAWGTTRSTFRCLVHNREPALQKVVLQVEDAPGIWRDVRGRFTIEFTAAGARRKAPGLVRPLLAVIEGPGNLRLAVRGVGRLQISDLELEEGGARRRVTETGRRIWLGAKAPAAGFPKLDWVNNLGKTLVVERVAPGALERCPSAGPNAGGG